jgi:hypothetical protein
MSLGAYELVGPLGAGKEIGQCPVCPEKQRLVLQPEGAQKKIESGSRSVKGVLGHSRPLGWTTRRNDGHCAHFCAHHRTLRSATEYRPLLRKPLQTYQLSHLVALHRALTKLLILRATNPWAQEVPGSNPGAPTKIPFRVFFDLTATASPKLHLRKTGSRGKIQGTSITVF